METTLRRFWFEFDVPPWAPGGEGRAGDLLSGASRAQLYLMGGCGVTGYDEQDCLQQIQQVLLSGEPMPAVVRTVADVDISSLDLDVRWFRVGVPVWRGIWYPAQPYDTEGRPRE